MKKIVTILSLITLFCCQSNQAKTDNKINNNSNSNNNIQTQTINSKITYDLPLEFNIFYECEEKTEKLYKFDKELNFEYFENQNSNKYKISLDDKKSLIDVLYKNDLYELNKKSEKIPIDAPQTEECRAIYQLILTINEKNNLFELNDRKFYHTKQYNEAFNNIKNKLDEIKNKYSKNFEKKEISLNQEITLNNEYKIKFIKIVEDSRCPENAQCVWAGRVIVKFQLIKNNNIESEFDLNIPEKDTFENTLFKIKLTNVSKEGKSFLEIYNLGDNKNGK